MSNKRCDAWILSIFYNDACSQAVSLILEFCLHLIEITWKTPQLVYFGSKDLMPLCLSVTSLNILAWGGNLTRCGVLTWATFKLAIVACHCFCSRHANWQPVHHLGDFYEAKHRARWMLVFFITGSSVKRGDFERHWCVAACIIWIFAFVITHFIKCKQKVTKAPNFDWT